jgi:DNA-binding NtrC family response regulator
VTLNPGAIMSSDALPTLHIATLERMAIRLALAETRGNRVRAARLLGIHVRTLHRKLHEFAPGGVDAAGPDRAAVLDGVRELVSA